MAETLVSEPKVQAFVTILFSGLLICLVLQFLLCSHRIPYLGLFLVRMNEILPLSEENNQAERTNGDANLVTVLVVRLVPCAIDLATN